MAEGLSVLASLSLCRFYLYSARLFSPLMSAASLLGLSEAASVGYIFNFDFLWLD